MRRFDGLLFRLRLWSDTLAGRMAAVLVVSIALLHVVSIWMYYVATEAMFEAPKAQGMAEQLLSIERTLSAASSGERDAAAHALSSEGFEVHWDATSLLPGSPPTDRRLVRLRNELVRFGPELGEKDLRLSFHQADSREHVAPFSSRHALLISFNLRDGSWANIAAIPPYSDEVDWMALLLSTTAMAVGILLVSVVLVRWVTAPWRILAQAAERAGIDTTQPVVAETGPREVRRAARAFNDMLARIRLLVTERAHTVAAISHDLRTPLTRQRLRLEFIDDAELRDKMQADLDEMEAMINSSLVYLRGDNPNEEQRSIDLVATLATICGDLNDAGHQVEVQESSPVTVFGRPLALKRAFSNLIYNAVKYGMRAYVKVITEADRALITIDDEGPGIPSDQRERVFDPFYRIEVSRSRETGGTGLGLTVARTLILAHGGDIRLGDRPGGGLRVEVTIPRTSRKGTQ